MIRLKGFARKTGRLTKGGSLPAPDTDTHPHADLNMGNNGHHNGNGNGTVPASRTHTDGGLPDSSSRLTDSDQSNGDGLRSYFRHIVEQLVEPHPPIEGVPPLDGNVQHPASNGSNGATLETIFARASVPPVQVKAIPFWKRLFDITCIVLSIPIWLPVLLIVMAWIKLVSPGPVFYRQERVGHRRRHFMMFKFRTMHVNAETRSHEDYFAHLMLTDSPMTKLDALDDNRLIRCGRLLRAAGLDELPQLFNVLFGQMSLVGPRPCLPKEFDLYTPAQQERVNAPPGLTGYWQVNGKNKTTFSEMIAMDVYYCDHMSLWLDVAIILKTVPALITQTMESRTGAMKPVGVVGPAALNGSTRK